jgi:hypothetical protein
MATDPTADDDFRPNQPSRFFCTSSDLHDLGENELKFGSRNEEGQTKLFAVFVLVVQLYGTLVLGGRRAGYIIIFLACVLGLVVPVIHMKGTRGVISGDIGNSSQAFLFVWTLLALGITSTFSVILSASALLSLPWPPEPQHVNCRITPDCGIRPATGTRPQVLVAIWTYQ